jgi:ring-1,2-phenylacetyl-CoA epoxidase subunit PaaC
MNPAPTAFPNAAPSAEQSAALIDLLFRLADDELVIGHRNSEWTGLGPIIEADIALSSMAQDEIGHAQAYYRLLHDLGRPDPDTLAFLRGPEEFRCASVAALPRGDWAFSITRQFLYDAAESVRLKALAVCSYRPLAELARKIAGEEKYHLLHGRTWVTKLGQGTDESRSRMQTALDAAFPHALGLFEPTKHDRAIAAMGLQPPESALRDRWGDVVEPVLAEAGLTAPSGVEPVYGGRAGRHPPELAELLEAMQKVYRIDPAAKW